MLLQGAADAYRANQAGRASEGLKLWPGGPFDPLGLDEDPDSLTELKAKETKNGRLSIMSMLAYAVQVIVPGEGPAENWAACTAHVLGANGLSLALMGQSHHPLWPCLPPVATTLQSYLPGTALTTASGWTLSVPLLST